MATDDARPAPRRARLAAAGRRRGRCVALLPALLSPYLQDLVLKIAIYAIFALSLELLVGMTGLVSLGHAAFLGIGAYVDGARARADGGGSVARCCRWRCSRRRPMRSSSARSACARAASTSSWSRWRSRRWPTSCSTTRKLGGGSDGIFLYGKPVLEVGGVTWLDLGDRLQLYYAVLAALAFTYGLLALIRRSRFGHALAGIRVNEQRMRAAGFRTYGYKLAAFVIAGALAGLAGFLLAVKDGAVNPELLSWHESGAVLLMMILGGIGSLRGAVIGAIAFTLLKELFQSEALLGSFASHWQMTLGLTIIAFVALLPQGLIGLARAAASGIERHG